MIGFTKHQKIIYVHHTFPQPEKMSLIWSDWKSKTKTYSIYSNLKQIKAEISRCVVFCFTMTYKVQIDVTNPITPAVFMTHVVK